MQHPPWIQLTDEEIDEWFLENTALKVESARKIIRVFESKLKEKNSR